MPKTAAVIGLVCLVSLWPFERMKLTEVRYHAEVIEASGPHADLIPPGTRFDLEYRLSDHTPDRDADPHQGFFPGALVHMQFAFPDRGIRAAVGNGGTVQTYRNIQTSDVHDQVYFYGSGVTSATAFGDEPIESIEADFLSAPGSDSTLIPSDALPLRTLRTDNATAVIATPRGSTTFRFAMRRPPDALAGPASPGGDRAAAEPVKTSP